MSGKATLGTKELYVLTLALLATHEIDSAYWHEWRLLGLPGEIEGFLAANLVLLLIFLYGLVCVVRNTRGARAFGAALSFAGVLAFGIHAWFLGQDRPEFRSLGSVAVLAATLLSSLALAWFTWRAGPGVAPARTERQANGRVGGAG